MDEIQIRQIIRQEITSVLYKQKENYEELKYVLTPNKLKAEIRKIITSQIENQVKAYLDHDIKIIIKRELENIIEIQPKITEEIYQQLQTINVAEQIDNKVKEHLITKTEHFVTEVMKQTNIKLNKKMDNRLKNYFDLKTSTIADIRHIMNDNRFDTKKDEYVLKEDILYLTD